MSFWSQYRGRCIGRVIHFLYHYAGMDVAEYAKIGTDRVEYRGKQFARYTWSDRFGRGDVTEFVFADDEDGRLALAQIAKEGRAIEDGCAVGLADNGRVAVPKEAVYVMMRDGYHAANVFCQGVHGAKPTFFVRDNRLFAEAAGWIYAWLPEANNWTIWVMGERSVKLTATDTAVRL